MLRSIFGRDCASYTYGNWIGRCGDGYGMLGIQADPDAARVSASSVLIPCLEVVDR
jgi:hypothetical protein